MALHAGETAWNMLVELRKEIVESQKIRAQVIGFKITAVSGGIGLAAAHVERLPGYALLLPAFAAVFFDILITSYSYSIKRSGYYIAKYLEPVISESVSWPTHVPLWEKFMFSKRAGENITYLGNLGITLLASIVGIASVLWYSDVQPSDLWQVLIPACLLLILLFFDFWYEQQPAKDFRKP